MAATTTSRLTELKTALAAKMAENDEIVGSVSEQDGTPVLEAKHFQAFQKNLSDAREIRAEMEALDEFKALNDWATQGPAAPAPFSGAPATDTRSLGQRFVDSEEFKSLQGGAAGYTMATPFQVKADLGGLWSPETKDVYTDLPTGTPGQFGTVTRDPFVTRAHRKTRVRDLFPVRRTSSNVIEYFRVTGFTNNASPVPERSGGNFGAKPQSSLTFVGEQSNVRTIAHWEAAHRNVLADEPQLAGIINDELLYGLRLHEDYQILSGAGSSEDLLGILNVSGIQTHAQADVANDTKADSVRRSVTKVLLSYYEPTGVVVHPNDWEDIELSKDENKNYIVAVSVALGGEPRMWRLPVVDTPAIPESTALVGAFGLGAQLYDREEANIRIAEQHSDFFVRNAIVVLAEERLALATKRPEAFVELTFT